MLRLHSTHTPLFSLQLPSYCPIYHDYCEATINWTHSLIHYLKMSGLEVISGISSVIALLGVSIKIYDSAKSDAKLSETFEVVRRRLPVIIHILQRCKN